MSEPTDMDRFNAILGKLIAMKPELQKDMKIVPQKARKILPPQPPRKG